MDLVCVGEMLIDFLPGAEAGTYIRKAGGAPANVAAAAARNGLKVGFCGRVGDDAFGRFLVKTLQDHNIAVLCPKPVEEAVTTMAFVTLTDDGERSFTFARKPGADMFLCCEDVDAARISHAAMLHAGSCSLSKGSAAAATVYAMRQAHEAGTLVSFDVNYRDVMWDQNAAACSAAVQGILPLVDLLKISEEERDLLGMEPADAAKHYGIAALVETLGADGARCWWEGKTLSVPGRKAHCVDATGAGDAFWGGFLAYLLKHGIRTTDDLTEECLLQALNYGNVAGWLCVQKKGAMEALPTTQEIEAILNA